MQTRRSASAPAGGLGSVFAVWELLQRPKGSPEALATLLKPNGAELYGTKRQPKILAIFIEQE